METVNGLEALNSLLSGNILEGGERYYKFNKKANQLEYSDNQQDWKVSSISINDILQWESWNVIK